MRPYVVRQGDFLRRLACRVGFDADTVWAHPRNADLRKLRASPDVLCPGDVLYVPDVREDQAPPLDLGASNRLSCEVPRVTVALKVTTHLQGRPLRYTVQGCGEVPPGETEADGTLRFEVPLDVTQAVVELPDLSVRLVVGVGHLDPSDERTGVAQRLQNLGVMSRYPAREAASTEEALREFRALHGAAAPEGDGADADTVKKLEEVYGG